MTIDIVLDEFENRIEPIKLANEIINLVSEEQLSVNNVREIIAYLSVYTRYNGTK